MAESASSESNKLKLRRLCSWVDNPCYIASFRDVNVLLDCPLDTSVLTYFMPQHQLDLPGASCNPPISVKTTNNSEIVKVDNRAMLDAEFEVGFLQSEENNTVVWDTIDVVLVSNYKTILGLPFITEHTSFRGKVLATEPTVQFGKILMEDLLECIAALPKQTKKRTVESKQIKDLPFPLMAVENMDTWRHLYTKSDVFQCLGRIEKVAYNQPVDLFGLLEVRGVSAGYAIGSCNWILQTPHEKIAYLSHTSLLYSHTMGNDFGSLRGCDVLVIGSISEYSNDKLEATVSDFTSKIISTLRDGGNVLVPTLPCGLVFDLMEALEAALSASNNDRYPMYLVSPRSKESTSYADIYAEWLNPLKEAQVFMADKPFVYSQLAKSDRLVTAPSLHGLLKFRTPCVVFASHPSLRLGPVVHLLRAWGQNPQNLLMLVDPDSVPRNIVVDSGGSCESVDWSQLLSPYQPLLMRVAQCNMESRLAPDHLSQVINQVAPRHVVILPCEHSQKPIILDPPASQCTAFALSTSEPIEVPFPARPERVQLDPRLADSLDPVQVGQDTQLTLFQAQLTTRDGHHSLQALDQGSRRPALVGGIEAECFLEELRKRGLEEAKMDSLDGGRHIVFFPNANTLIQLEPESTHIICEDETTRQQVRDALLACLTLIPA